MISYLKGKIYNKGKGYLIILVSGVGYKVRVNSSLYVDSVINNEIELYIYHHITDQSQALFGLLNMEELEFFELLLSVSGIGPKIGLAALSISDVNELKIAILHEDTEILNKISGIGKKTAERIVLELKTKIEDLGIAPGKNGTVKRSVNHDEIEALITLGYQAAQARKVLSEIDKELSSGERIKEALKRL